jgi:hypothetical protein
MSAAVRDDDPSHFGLLFCLRDNGDGFVRFPT